MKTRVLAKLALIAAAGAAQAHAQTPSRFEAGKHYAVLATEELPSTPRDKVEVAEIFMFGCPGCFAFEPHIQRWLATKPAYVQFVRIPAPWNPLAVLHARAYFAAAALGKAQEIDGPFFEQIHVEGNPLDSEAKIAELFAAYGVDGETFEAAFNSPAVTAALARAEELVRLYGVQSTPTVVVNGKYLATGPMAGSYTTWLAIVDELAAREHESRSPSD